MTRIFADPQDFVDDALEGFALVHASEVTRVDGGIVRARPLEHGQVAVVIGGGSGHYPAFAGYVGSGMAAGAVCGNVFTSPSAAQAVRVAEAAEAGGGVLFAYGKYAGDVLHFGEAERRLVEGGREARTVHITDDVASALPEDADERRGIAGVVCVIHVAGAAAERGDDLSEVERLARLANSRTRSHGVAFAGCTLPGAAHPLFEVPDGMMSIGLGIHGEPGVRDVPLQQAPELARTLLEPLLRERPEGARRAALLVNGLGTVKNEELFVLFRFVVAELERIGVEVVGPECGELVTSLDMAGVSLTVMWLDDELEELWRAPISTPALRRGSFAVDAGSPDARVATAPPRSGGTAQSRPASAALPVSTQSRAAASTAQRLLRLAHAAVAEHVDVLGDLDAVAGDGDHGVGMLRGLAAAVAAAEAHSADEGVCSLLARAGEQWSEVAGGTSGALWGAALIELGIALGDDGPYTGAIVAAAVSAARSRVQAVGGAVVGDKTMLDAIVPFEDRFAAGLDRGEDVTSALRGAVAVARTASEQTAALSPRRGRARPLAERSVGHADPGATSFVLIVDSLVRDADLGEAGTPAESEVAT
ncbi:dihydroxyacetone kinase family protein [Microbacterium sp. P05]|uniref:dihydroxyacetone kinase family protein n=1 Tax=Microbacterium sp. P05 TaxID=3366948 RepID=UPI003746EC70